MSPFPVRAPRPLAIDGSAASRVFHIGSGKTVAMPGVTQTNGSAGFEHGGAILNDHAMLTIDNCAVQNSSAQSGYGGGIYNKGFEGNAAVTIHSSTVSFNYASYAGGWFHNHPSGGTATVTIINSMVYGNSAAYDSLPFGGEARAAASEGTIM